MPEVTYLLFTTSTCRKCPTMKVWVTDNLAWCPGEIIDNTRPDFLDKVQAYDVTTAPTFILLEKGRKPVFRTDEVCALADYFSDYVQT